MMDGRAVTDRLVTSAFSFEDINPGLGLKTSCSNYLPRGSNATVENDSYHLCDSHDVQFKYNGQILQVERWYQDPCKCLRVKPQS